MKGVLVITKRSVRKKVDKDVFSITTEYVPIDDCSYYDNESEIAEKLKAVQGDILAVVVVETNLRCTTLVAKDDIGFVPEGAAQLS